MLELIFNYCVARFDFNITKHLRHYYAEHVINISSILMYQLAGKLSSLPSRDVLFPAVCG
jgi:hypothetical protein